MKTIIVARKRWTPNTEETPALLKFREKRKWQISLRRYVLEQSPCPLYAPYFGLDIKKIREWFALQFQKDFGWEDFGKKWQFDHIIPVTYFDFSSQAELKMCWNFTNIRVEALQQNKDSGNRLDVLAAKGYFEELYKKTSYKTCLDLLHKIERIELSEIVSTEPLKAFIMEHKAYLEVIENYSTFEFELLNSGRSLEEVKKEIQFMKNTEK